MDEEEPPRTKQKNKKLVFDNGDVYRGHVLYENGTIIPNGRGRLILDNGKVIYRGNFSDGEFNSKPSVSDTLMFPRYNMKYSGEWENGMLLFADLNIGIDGPNIYGYIDDSTENIEINGETYPTYISELFYKKSGNDKEYDEYRGLTILYDDGRLLPVSGDETVDINNKNVFNGVYKQKSTNTKTRVKFNEEANEFRGGKKKTRKLRNKRKSRKLIR